MKAEAYCRSMWLFFLSFFGYALTIALFIPMLMDSHVALLPAASPTAIRVTLSGLLLSMYPLGQFLGSPVIGHLSDHFGRKKILILSLVLCIIGFSGIGISIYLHSLVWLFISCIFTGLCESNMAISQSIISDQARDGQQKIKLIGYTFSACSLGYVLGPLLGGLAAHQFGYSIPFIMTAAFVIVLIGWFSVSFKDSYKPSATIKINIWEAIFALKTLFTHKHIRKIYLINFLIFFAVQGLYRVVPLYLVDTWHPSLLVYSHIIAYVSFLCLLASLFFISHLAKHFSTKPLLIGLLMIGAVCIFSIVIPKQFHWIWLTYGLAVIPTVMALTICTAWLSNQVDSKEQGQVLGNNQALLVLGEASSAAIGGAVAAINISLPVIMMGFILLLCSFMIFRKK